MKSLKLSIYMKMLLLVTFTSIVTSIFSLFSSGSEISKLLNSEAEQICLRTARSLAFPFWNLDSVGVSEIVDAQMHNTNMYAITLREKNNTTQFVKGLIKENGEIKPLTETIKDDLPYQFRAPVVFEGEELGTVTVTLTDKILKSFIMKNQVGQSLFELVILFLLAFPLSYIIAKSFLDPVEKLARSFHFVVENRFETPVPQVQEREIMTLADIFEKVRLTTLDLIAKVRKNEKDLTITLNSISDGIVSVDKQRNVIRMNPIAEQLLGVSLENVVGTKLDSVLQLATLNDESIKLDSLDELFIGETSKQLRYSLHNAQTGDVRKVDVSSSRIIEKGSESSGDVLVIRDVTDQLNIEDELKQRRKMESLGQLSGGVAHDFNNMLGGIIGFSELLEESLDSESEEREYVGHILEAANSAADLTAKLLAFSRKGKMVSTPFSIHNTCESAISLLSRTINKNIAISSTLDAEDVFVTGDPSQIQNAILNLCINAKDAMPEGGTLSLKTTNVTIGVENEFQLPEGRYVCIAIADTGTGIPEELQQKIFEPFFTTKGTGKGTGLGLAAVYGAVQNHHGTIRLDSKVGQGTTFTVMMPVEEHVENIVQEQLETRVDQLKKHVLVVDDERILRAIVDKVVTELGGTVMQASDGVEAVALFREKHSDIDIVILDLVMPNMNGDECFDKLKEIDPTVPIVISSGFDRNSSITRLLEDGAVAYLHKPFEISELTRVLHTCTL